MLRLAAILTLLGCGPAPMVLPPNTVQACTKAAQCGAIAAEDTKQCVSCLDHVRPELLDAINILLADHPIDTWTCGDVESVVAESNLSACIAGKWRW